MLRHCAHLKSLLAICLLLAPSLSSVAKCIKINPSEPLQEQFSTVGATYVIKSNLDLRGKTLIIPDGSTLSFRRGSLNNGTISGTFKLKRVKRASLNVRYSNCSISGIVPVYNSGDVVGLLSSCVEECKLMENLSVDKSIKLRASINGNGYTITCSEKTPVAIYINDSKTPITIDGLVIKKLIPTGTINQNYAINSTNSSNITIKNSTIEGRIRFVNKTMSDAPADISENINIIKSHLYADFSVCPQGWEYGQDHLAFYSIKNVRIEDCTIISKNVNRVIKTSAYFPDKNYDHPQNCTDGLIFRNNQVTAEAQIGKQFWDMFCGTVNVQITSNTINLQGFTRFVENKAYQPKYRDDTVLESLIAISQNQVGMKNGGSLFQFHANSDHDSFLLSHNSFCLGGSNINPISGSGRTNGIKLQGYKSCTITNNKFEWTDEASGLPFAGVNFLCGQTFISGNTFTNTYRITVSKANHMSNTFVPTVCERFELTDNTYNCDAGSTDIPVVTTDCTILYFEAKGNEGIPSPDIIRQGRGTQVDILRTQ